MQVANIYLHLMLQVLYGYDVASMASLNLQLTRSLILSVLNFCQVVFVKKYYHEFVLGNISLAQLGFSFPPQA